MCLRACVCVLKKGEMTFAYSCCFVSIWLTGLAGLVFLLPVIGWFSIQTAFEGVNPFLVTTLIVVCVLAVFGAWTRFWPTLKHRIRAGVLFEGLFSDAFPTTEEELMELSMKAYKVGKGGGLGVTTVSHGWSFFLQKESAPGPRIWTTRFKGAVDEDEFIPRVWKAGTALADVKKNFKNVGRTMLDSPSMEWLSLGSWICSSSHGHPGALSSSPSPLHWVKRARVLDCETRQITDDDEATLYSKFHSSTSKKTRYVILTVEIKAESIVEDSIVQRFATRIETPDRLNEWRRGNHVRLMFVSRHTEMPWYRLDVSNEWKSESDSQVPHASPRLFKACILEPCRRERGNSLLLQLRGRVASLRRLCQAQRRVEWSKSYILACPNNIASHLYGVQ